MKKARRGVNELANHFLATTGCEAVNKILTMADPKELEEITYGEIVRIIKKTI